jgi:hypothetical protein
MLILKRQREKVFHPPLHVVHHHHLQGEVTPLREVFDGPIKTTDLWVIVLQPTRGSK